MNVGIDGNEWLRFAEWVESDISFWDRGDGGRRVVHERDKKLVEVNDFDTTRILEKEKIFTSVN